MDDLDMAVMATLLGAPMKPAGRGLTPWDNAARLIREFAAAGTFTPPPATGTATWFGESFTVHPDGGDGSSFVILRLRAGSNGNGVEGNLETLKPENFDESADAMDLARALRAGTAPVGENRVIEFLRSAKARAAFVALAPTTGTSMVLPGDPAVFLRAAGERVLAIERGPSGSSNRRTPLEGAGRYAELWRIP